MKPKGNVFFDLDGLQFDTLPSQVAFINHHYQIRSDISEYRDGVWLEEIVNRHLKPSVPLTREAVYRDHSRHYLSSKKWHEEIRPMEGMPQVMKQVVKKYRLWTVTARHMAGINIIRYLLNVHIPDCMHDIHCVWRYEEGAFKDVSKRSFMENVPGEKVAYFDDSPNEIVQIQTLMPSYLFDPHGTHDQDIRIACRMRDWKEIGDLLL